MNHPLCPDRIVKLHGLILPEIVQSCFKTLTLCAVTTSFDKEFHGLTTLTAKLLFLISSRDSCILSFIECPLEVVLCKRCNNPSVMSLW